MHENERKGKSSVFNLHVFTKGRSLHCPSVDQRDSKYLTSLL